jgi:ElaB/YqjD/DUF883 family membrane-anchored ribosome-binding protein
MSTAENTTAFADKAAQLKTLVEELASAAPSAARDVACQAKERAIEAGKKVCAAVRKHPVEATAIAVGVGLLAWWLLSRGHSAKAE